jgi:hypothetical protein
MRDKKLQTEVDTDTGRDLREWAREEGRSVFRHTSLILKRITQARKRNPEKVKEVLEEGARR